MLPFPPTPISETIRYRMNNSPSATTAPRNRRKLLLVGSFLVLVAGSFILGDPRSWLNGAISAVEELGPWGPLVFGLAYIAATLLLVPGSALTLSAGTLFGVVSGTVIVSVVSTTAAALAFLVGRFLAREAIAARVAGNPSFSALDRALGRDGWKIVALARLSPLFPFTLLNYAFGLTQVRFTHYVLASWVAMLPGTMLYVYLGSLARAGARGAEKTPLEWTLYAVGLLATLAVTVFITRAARKAMREKGLAVAEGKGTAA